MQYTSKYEYVPSKLANSNIKLTFKEDKGLVNESGLNVHRLDNSTLILYNNRKKSSTIEVYQINRDLNKAHILSSRVGSKKLELEFLRDKSCTYNGDAKLIEKKLNVHL